MQTINDSEGKPPLEESTRYPICASLDSTLNVPGGYWETQRQDQPREPASSSRASGCTVGTWSSAEDVTRGAPVGVETHGVPGDARSASEDEPCNGDSVPLSAGRTSCGTVPGTPGPCLTTFIAVTPDNDGKSCQTGDILTRHPGGRVEDPATPTSQRAGSSVACEPWSATPIPTSTLSSAARDPWTPLYNYQWLPALLSETFLARRLPSELLDHILVFANPYHPWSVFGGLRTFIYRGYHGWDIDEDARPMLSLCVDRWAFTRADTWAPSYTVVRSSALKIPLPAWALWGVVEYLMADDIYNLGLCCRFVLPQLARDYAARGLWISCFLHPNSALPAEATHHCCGFITEEGYVASRLEDDGSCPHQPHDWTVLGPGYVEPALHVLYPNTSRLAETVERALPHPGDPDPPRALCFFHALKAAKGWLTAETTAFMEACRLPIDQGVALEDAVRACLWGQTTNVGFLAYDHHLPSESELRDLPPGDITDKRWQMWSLGPSHPALPWLIYVPAVDCGPDGGRLDCAHWVAAGPVTYRVDLKNAGHFTNPPPDPLPSWHPFMVCPLDIDLRGVGDYASVGTYWETLSLLPFEAPSLPTTPSASSLSLSSTLREAVLLAINEHLPAPTWTAPDAVRHDLAAWLEHEHACVLARLGYTELEERHALRLAHLWARARLPGVPPYSAYQKSLTEFREYIRPMEMEKLIVTDRLDQKIVHLMVTEDVSRDSLLDHEHEAFQRLLDHCEEDEHFTAAAAAARDQALGAIADAIRRLFVGEADMRRVLATEEDFNHGLTVISYTQGSRTLYLQESHAAIPMHTADQGTRAATGDAHLLSPFGPNVVFIGAIPPQLHRGAHWAHDPRQQIATRGLVETYRAAGMTVCDHGAWQTWCPCIWSRIWSHGWPTEIRTTAEVEPRLAGYQQLVARDGWQDVMVHTTEVDMGGPGGVQLGFRDQRYNMVATHAGAPPQASNAHHIAPALLSAVDPDGAASTWTVMRLDEDAALRRLLRHLGYHALAAGFILLLLLAAQSSITRHVDVLLRSLAHEPGTPFASWFLEWMHWFAAAIHVLVRTVRDVSTCAFTPGCHHITPLHIVNPMPIDGLPSFTATILYVQLVTWSILGHLLSCLLVCDVAVINFWLARLLVRILLFRRLPGIAWVPYQPRAMLQRALKLFTTPEQARLVVTTSLAMGDEVNAVKGILTSTKSIGHSNKFKEMTLTDHVNGAQCIVVCLRAMRFGPSPGRARVMRKVVQNVTPHTGSRGDCPWCGAKRPKGKYRWHMGECPACWAVANDKAPASSSAEAWRTWGLDEGGHIGIAPLRALELPPPKIQVDNRCTLKVEPHAPLDRPREDLGICGWGLGFLLPRARPYVTEKSYVGLIKGVLCRLAKMRKHEPEPDSWRLAAQFNDVVFPVEWDSQKIEPYSQEEWRKGFHPRRIKAFNQAWDTYTWLGETWCARFEKFTIFLKREWLADGADGMPIQIGKPRLIQSPHDITHVLAGPALKRLTHLLKAWWHVSHPIFYASVTPTKLDAWLNSLPEDAVYLWCDYKMFDATHSRESWEFVRNWYETLLPESFLADHHWKAVMDAWQNPRGKAWARTGEKVRYAAEGINASGRDDTALANALLNGVAMMIALTAVDNGVHPRQVTREQMCSSMSIFRLAVVGDDSVAALPAMRRTGEPWLLAGGAVAEAIAHFGFEAEVGTSVHRADAVFLGQRPYRYHSGWHWGPTLGRRLYKHHCLLAPAVHRSAWLLGVADMEVRAFNHVPVMRQMAAAVVRVLAGRKRTKWSMFRDGHTNLDPEFVVDWSQRQLLVEPDDLTYEELVGVYQRAGHVVTRADFHDLERQAEEANRLPHVVTGKLAEALAMTDL
jgi:hypothetical protein